jgi:hypothetical protein
LNITAFITLKSGGCYRDSAIQDGKYAPVSQLLVSLEALIHWIHNLLFILRWADNPCKEFYQFSVRSTASYSSTHKNSGKGVICQRIQKKKLGQEFRRDM